MLKKLLNNCQTLLIFYFNDLLNHNLQTIKTFFNNIFELKQD